MPTQVLRVQQNGHFTGWLTLVGGIFGYDCVDDSDGMAHDSATSYLVLPKQSLPLQQGTVSFPLFLQAEGLLPQSITINVVATRGGVAHPRLKIGLERSGLTAFDPSWFTTTATWDLAQRTFSANPITGSPWSASDLIGLEVCVQNEGGVNGSNDVTLISGSIDYAPISNVRHRIPESAGEQ